jgi:hypothetical protein
MLSFYNCILLKQCFNSLFCFSLSLADKPPSYDDLILKASKPPKYEDLVFEVNERSENE